MSKSPKSPAAVTPFDWRNYTAAASAPQAPKPAARAKKKLTVQERIDRILAHRWGNPYCKPGAA